LFEDSDPENSGSDYKEPSDSGDDRPATMSARHQDVSDFDPTCDSVEDFLYDLENAFDGYKPGTLDDKGKISLVSRYCTHPDMRDLIRSWREGSFLEAGTDDRHHQWADVTWELAREALREAFPVRRAAERAVKDLGSIMQDCKATPFNNKLQRLHREAGVPMDMESKSLVNMYAYAKLFQQDFPEGMSDCKKDTIYEAIVGAIEDGTDKKLKHCFRRAEKQCRVFSSVAHARDIPGAV